MEECKILLVMITGEKSVLKIYSVDGHLPHYPFLTLSLSSTNLSLPSPLSPLLSFSPTLFIYYSLLCPTHPSSLLHLSLHIFLSLSLSRGVCSVSFSISLSLSLYLFLTYSIRLVDLDSSHRPLGSTTPLPLLLL